MAGAADSQRIVLIAVDASEHSKRAFNYYTSRVSMENDRVIICHVPEQPNLPVFSAKDGLNIPVEEWRKTMQDTMERVHALEKEYEAEMVQRKIHYQTISESAKSPGVGIIESARKVNASLIIMGSRDYISDIRQPNDKVVICQVQEMPNLPVLSCRDYLSDLHRNGDEVVLCHVSEQPNLNLFSFKDGLNIPTEEWKKTIEESIQKVTVLEEQYQQELIYKKIPSKMVKRTGKSPGAGIVEVAAEEKVSLVVMGSRGLNALRRTFMGSVSEYVLNHVGLPVLIIPPTRD